MIKNVIFDVGNVLVDFRWRALMEDLGLPKELQPIFEKSAFTNPWWGELDLGVMEEEDVLEKLREENKEYLEEFNLVWDNRVMAGNAGWAGTVTEDQLRGSFHLVERKWATGDN